MLALDVVRAGFLPLAIVSSEAIFDYYFFLVFCRTKGTWVTFSALISEEVAEEIVVLAFDSGINVFDLSDGYCGPRAELTLGRILRQRRWKRSSFVIITKIYWSYRYV